MVSPGSQSTHKHSAFETRDIMAEDPSRACPMKALAEETLGNIMTYLPHRDRSAAAQTCSTLARINEGPSFPNSIRKDLTNAGFTVKKGENSRLKVDCDGSASSLNCLKAFLEEHRDALGFHKQAFDFECRPKPDWEALKELLSSEDSPSLFLYLGKLRIPTSDTPHLKSIIEQSSCLKSLELKVNYIFDDGAGALAEALKDNQTLTELNLGVNQIGDDGAKALAEALRDNQALRTLELRSNRIKDDGARALAEALMDNQTLRKLDLSFNRIDVAGAEALRSAWNARGERPGLLLKGNEFEWAHLRR